MPIGDFDPHFDPERSRNIRHWSEKDPLEGFPKNHPMEIGKIEPLVVGECVKSWDGIDSREFFIPKNDNIDHPKHYKTLDMEAIDIIEMIISKEPNTKVAYNMSNVIKYMLRFRHKGKPVEDMKKARWYLDRMIMHLEKE